jgi:hypothetical protein
MAHSESDREDLLREATALVERAELRIDGDSEPVTVGFRKDGSLSVYFGSERVYQFNAAGQLRRAFIAGLLYKAEQGRLVALRRQRMPSEVVLQRIELHPAESEALLEDIQQRLQGLHLALHQRNYELLGEVPPQSDVPGRVAAWLAEHPQPISIALRPHV